MPYYYPELSKRTNFPLNRKDLRTSCPSLAVGLKKNSPHAKHSRLTNIIRAIPEEKLCG